MRQARPVGGHPVLALDRAQRDHLVVGSLVALHADGLHGEQHGEALPDALRLARAAQLVAHDRVGGTNARHALVIDGADDAHREPRAGERLARDQLLGEAEVAANGAHLVLEQLAQWLDQLQLHALRQPADVVVRLDRRRRAAHRHRLDDVRIESALREPAHVVERVRRLVEDLDEQVADALALDLGIDDVLQRGEKPLAGVDGADVEAEVRERFLDHRAVAGAQQAVVDEDAGEPLADRAVQECGRDGRVDAARQAADHSTRRRLLADARHRLLDERARCPVGGGAADAVHEVGEHLAAALAVHDLGVELHAEETPGRIAERLDRRVGALREHGPAGRQRLHAVAVRHPHGDLAADREAAEQVVGVGDLDRRAAVLATVGGRDARTGLDVQDAHAVADAEHRHAELEDAARELRRARDVHARRAAGQDDAGRLALRDLLDVDRAGQDLAVDARLADAARDQLCVLTPEVQDENHLPPRGAPPLSSARLSRTEPPLPAR